MIVMNRNQMIEMMIKNLLCYFIVFSINRMSNDRRSKRQYMKSYSQNIEN